MSEFDEYKKHLEFSYVSYQFCLNSLPKEEFIPDDGQVYNGVLFRRRENVYEMIVEFGWAFFVRMEATLESFLHDRKPKNMNIIEFVEAILSGLSQSDRDGYGMARELRNILHHVDSQSEKYSRRLDYVEVEKGKEPHILREHIERFFDLFVRMGAKAAEYSSQ